MFPRALNIGCDERGISYIRSIGVAAFIVTLAGCSPSVRPRFEGFTFSPDGKCIFSPYDRSGSSFIYKIALDTGKATRFTTATSGFEGVPSFSPDGKRIAYSYSPGKERSRIIVADADGSGARPLLTSEDANYFRPLFATDTVIVFARSG